MIFWSVVAGATIVVIFLVLLPLVRGSSEASGEHTPELDIYKDQLAEVEQDIARGVLSDAEAQAAKTEIARRLLAAADAQEKVEAESGSKAQIGAGVIGLAALALTVGSYALVGSPGLPGQPLAQRATQTDTNPDLSKLVLQVEKQLEKTPNDVRGWSVLGPALMRLRRFNDAADAFRKAAALAPGNADLQTSYGEALTLSEAGLVSASAQQAFTAALSINPKHPKARFYLAIAAYQDGRKTDAISLWKELLADSPPNAPWRRTVMTHIQRAEAAEGVQTAEGAKPAEGVQTAEGVKTAQANEARPPALDQETISNAEQMSEADQQEMIKGMVNRLADRLAENGDDLGGWLRLMRARMVLGQRDLATKALGDARASFEGDTASLERLNAFAKELGLETN